MPDQLTTPPELSPIDIRLEPDGSTVTVLGAVDRCNGHDMRTFLEGTDLRAVPEVTIDLSGVEMLLVCGLRELAEGFRFVRDGGSLVVVHAPDDTLAGRVIEVLRRIDERERGRKGVEPLPPAA